MLMLVISGEDEWQRLSERERQHHLMKLKLETKRLKRENKLDELARLLGDGFATDGNLRKLLGVNREEYEQRLRERLARRRERLAQGLPAEDDEEESKDMESRDEKSLFESLDERCFAFFTYIIFWPFNGQKVLCCFNLYDILGI